MRKKNKRTAVASILVTAVSAFLFSSGCFSTPALSKEPVYSLFEDKVVELVKRYGRIPQENNSWTVEVNEDYQISEMPEGFDLHDGGLIAADIYDYDGDGVSELLVFRKQAGTETAPIWEGNQSFARDVYVLEMYEVRGGACTLSTSRKLGVFGDFYPISFIARDLLIFRHSINTRTEICIEAYISEMDHGGDDAVLTFAYTEDGFTMGRGTRIGVWWDGESPEKYLRFKSGEAYEYLCCRDYTIGWELAAAGEEAMDGFSTGLKDLGFSLTGRRNEVSEDPAVQDETAQAVIYEESAADHLPPVDGEITELFRSYLYNETWKMEDTHWHYKRVRQDCTGYIQTIVEKQMAEPEAQQKSEGSGKGTRKDSGKVQSKGTERSPYKQAETVAKLPDGIPSTFVFTSGAGAWATQITLQKDGTFTGQFRDEDPGAHELYYCDFTGKFTNIMQKNTYTYSMELGELNVLTEKGQKETRSGTTRIGSDPYGFDDWGKDYLLFLPETPVSGLNETFLSWVTPVHSITGDRLGCTAIYDASGEQHYGFVGLEEETTGGR